MGRGEKGGRGFSVFVRWKKSKKKKMWVLTVTSDADARPLKVTEEGCDPDL